MATPEISRGLNPDELVAERYVVKRRLGSGGMGEAWLAEDRILHRKLVLKQLKGAQAAGPSDSAHAAQSGHLLGEAKRAAAIDSPHIAQVYDVCSHRGEWLVAMEYVAGQNLRAVLATPLTAETFFSLAVQIAEAIEAAHAAGILHCDIKPENIMVTEQSFVKVLDFGLARITSKPGAASETVSLAGAHAFAGTPGYIAPEVLRENPPTEQSDIFALGVVLYEMAGGKAPFKGRSLADSVQMTLSAEPGAIDPGTRGLPSGLNRVLQKALMKDPQRRYATVHDLLVDLRDCASRHDASSGGNHRRSTMVAAAGIGLISIFAMVVGWILVYRYEHRAPPAKPVAAAASGVRLLAVLPFQVIPDDARLSAYSEGLRDAITTSLAQVASAAQIEVLAASEVRSHGLRTPEEAHKELGADLVIDGSYEEHGNQVRIRYELTSASARVTGQPGEVRSTSDDPFKLEDDVVAGVLEMLRVSSTGPTATTPQTGTQHAGTQVPAAYEAYLQGVGYLRDFDIADNLTKAEAKFTEATQADPEFASAYAGLGEAQWAAYQARSDAADVTRAGASCGKALALNGQVAEAHICQGTVDDGTGKTKQAQQDFQEALRLDPQSDTALNGLARTWEEMEEPDQAQKVYRQAIEARPYYWANYFALANFLMRHADYKQAAATLEQAVAKFPANSFLMRRLGVAYFLEGRLTEAATTFQSAIQARPHAEAYMDLGQVYVHQGEFGPAIAALESAAQLKPQSFAIEADLADAYAWDGQTSRANARYQNALDLSRASLKVNAQDLDAMMVEAYCGAALGRRSDALDALNAALRHAPEDAEVNYYAARVYGRLGDQAAARDWTAKAIARGYSKADIDTAPDMKRLLPPG